jgi:tight adherence protein B
VLPPWAIALVLIAVVALVVVVLYGVLVSLAGVVRRSEPAEGPSLAERAESLLRARRASQFDARFERMAEGTQLGLTGATAIGWILFGTAIFAVVAFLLTIDEFSSLAAGLLGGLFVFLLFYMLRNRRRRAIQEQLPDGCFQLARSLRSGLNLPAALHETAHYVPRPLSGLFERLATALALGEATRPALRRVADDAEVTEFDLFTEVLALNAESGGNLPAMLDRLAASIRDRNQYRGYFRSVTALARASAIFLALAAPLAVILYMAFEPDMWNRFLTYEYGPDRLRLGVFILLGAIGLEVLGLLWMALLLRRQDDY